MCMVHGLFGGYLSTVPSGGISLLPQTQKEPVTDFPEDFDNRLYIVIYQSVRGVRVDPSALLTDFEIRSIGDRFISQS